MRVIWEEKVVTKELSLSDLPMGQSVGTFSCLMIDVGGPTVGSATPEQVVLRCRESRLCKARLGSQ